MNCLRWMTIAAVLSGCGAEPVLEQSSLRHAANEYITAYNEADVSHLTEIFAADPPAEAYRRHFAWMQERVGACGAPRGVWQAGLTRAGFSYPCERGSVFQLFTLDAHGKISRTVGGAAGIPAEGAVAAKLDQVLAAMPGDRATLASQPWSAPLTRSWVRARGRCELGRTVVVGEYSGAFELRCEGGHLTLKLVLKTDGEIDSIEVWRNPQDLSGTFPTAQVD